MGLVELALALVTAGAAAAASGVPVAAWLRQREPRFLAVAGAALALFVLGLLWAWAELVPDAPGVSAASLPEAAVGALAAVLLLSTGAVPRRG
ncbi:MAG TPA: hypothetical protein VMH78_09020 [Thermoplasmata archaeon]|nr:hypothetical protein [Thermoplasmata archaeon]